MAANTVPIFPLTPQVGFGNLTITAANTAKDGTGVISSNGTNRCAYSDDDGVTFSDTASLDVTNNWNTVIWCAGIGIFVAASVSGNVSYSYDGITWSATISVGSSLPRLSYSPQLKTICLVFSVANIQTCLLSRDGASWYRGGYLRQAGGINQRVIVWNSRQRQWISWNQAITSGLFGAFCSSRNGYDWSASSGFINNIEFGNGSQLGQKPIYIPELDLIVACIGSPGGGFIIGKSQ